MIKPNVLFFVVCSLASSNVAAGAESIDKRYEEIIREQRDLNDLGTAGTLLGNESDPTTVVEPDDGSTSPPRGEGTLDLGDPSDLCNRYPNWPDCPELE